VPVTENDGVAAFSDLAFGEATVLIQRPGYARARQGWRGGQHVLRIPLTAEGIVKGTVTMAGRPLSSYQVTLRSTGDSFFTEATPDHGAMFQFNELPAGEYALEVRDERRVLHRATITVKSGKTHQLAFDAPIMEPSPPK
jgi:hypothetical protein